MMDRASPLRFPITADLEPRGEVGVRGQTGRVAIHAFGGARD